MSSAWFCVTSHSCMGTKADFGQAVVFLSPVLMILRAPGALRPKVQWPIPRDRR